MKALVNWVMLAVVAVGVGYGPNGPLARRAAVVDGYRQLAQQGIAKGFVITNTIFENNKCIVTMEVK